MVSLRGLNYLNPTNFLERAGDSDSHQDGWTDPELSDAAIAQSSSGEEKNRKVNVTRIGSQGAKDRRDRPQNYNQTSESLSVSNIANCMKYKIKLSVNFESLPGWQF